MTDYYTTKTGRVVKRIGSFLFNGVAYIRGESVAGGWTGQLRFDRLRPATAIEIEKAARMRTTKNRASADAEDADRRKKR